MSRDSSINVERSAAQRLFPADEAPRFAFLAFDFVATFVDVDVPVLPDVVGAGAGAGDALAVGAVSCFDSFELQPTITAPLSTIATAEDSQTLRILRIGYLLERDLKAFEEKTWPPKTGLIHVSRLIAYGVPRSSTRANLPS